MADAGEFGRFLDVPVAVEAAVAGPALRVDELLALSVGQVLQSPYRAGESLDVTAGNARIGAGELSERNGRVAVRLVDFARQE